MSMPKTWLKCGALEMFMLFVSLWLSLSVLSTKVKANHLLCGLHGDLGKGPVYSETHTNRTVKRKTAVLTSF